NVGPGCRCGALACPGSSVTSTVVAFACFPSIFSVMSFWESVFTPPLPCSACCARVIPPTARVPKTIANRVHRMSRPPIEPSCVRHSATRTLYPSGEPPSQGRAARLAQPIPARAARRRSGPAIQLRGCVHEVRRREPFRVCAVDGGQRGAGVVTAPLPLPEPGETHRGTQLPRLTLLAPGRFNGRAEAPLGGGLVIRFGQVQLASEAVQFGFQEALVTLFPECQALIQYPPRVIELESLRVCLPRDAEIAR